MSSEGTAKRKLRSRDEPHRLAERIVAKARASADDQEALQDFVALRYERPLAISGRYGNIYNWLFTGLSVVGIAGGLAASALAADGGDTDWIVVIIGIVVAVATTINQIVRPGQRSVARYQGANALRREGWDFVWDRGRYAEGDARARLSAFIDEVQRVNRAVESVDEETPEAQAVIA